MANSAGWGRRQLAPYLPVAAGVALVLLLAPASYAAFGLLFLLLVVGLATGVRGRVAGLLHSGLEPRPAARATAP